MEKSTLSSTIETPTRLARLSSIGYLRIKTTTIVFIFTVLTLIMPTLHLLPKSLGSLDRSLEEFWDFGLIGVWIILMLLGNRKMAVRPKGLFYLFWFFPVAILISTFMYGLRGGIPTFDDVYAFLYALRPLVLVQLVLLVLRRGHIQTHDGIEKIMRSFYGALAGVMIFVSLVGILQFLKFSPVYVFIQVLYGKEILLSNEAIQISVRAIDQYNRATSIFPWANHFGMFEAVGILLLFHYTVRCKGVQRYFSLVAITLGMAGLVLTGSRASVVVVVLGIFLLLIIRRQFKILPLVILASMILGLLFVYFSSYTGSSSRVSELTAFLSGQGGIPRTFQDRLVNYQFVLGTFFQTPLAVITGTSVSGNAIVQGVKNGLSFDNEYLKYFVTTGVWGLLMFILFEIGVIIYTWRLTRQYGITSQVGFLSSSLWVVFIPMSFAAFSQDVWPLAKVMHMVFIVFGIMQTAYQLEIANKPPEAAVSVSN